MRKNKIEYVGIGKMYDTDKQNMYEYKVVYNGKTYRYFEGLGLEKLNKGNYEEKLKSAIECLEEDYKTYLEFKNDYDMFCRVFGYDTLGLYYDKLDNSLGYRVFKNICSNGKKMESKIA